MKFNFSPALIQTAMYGFSLALMRGVSIIMLPFVVNHLNPSEFGRLEVLTSLAAIGSILVGMGLENSLYRFAGHEKTDQGKKKLSATIYSFSMIMSIIALSFCFIFAEKISTLLPAKVSILQTQLVLAVIALEGCIAVPLGWLRMRDKAILFCIANAGRAGLQAILVFILLNQGYGVTGVLTACLIAALSQTILLCYWHIKDVGFLTLDQSIFSIIQYSWPLVISGIIAFTFTGLDRWVLAHNVDLANVGQYGIAAKFALATTLLMQPFCMWWLPKRFQILSSENGPERAAFYTSVGIIFIALVIVSVMLSSPLLINTLFPPEYKPAIIIALGLITSATLKELTELINIGCFIGKSTKTQLKINFTSGVTGVGLMLILAPIYGVWGVVTALITSRIINLTFFYIESQKQIKINYPIKNLLVIGLIALSWIVLAKTQLADNNQAIVIIPAVLNILWYANRHALLPKFWLRQDERPV